MIYMDLGHDRRNISRFLFMLKRRKYGWAPWAFGKALQRKAQGCHALPAVVDACRFGERGTRIGPSVASG